MKIELLESESLIPVGSGLERSEGLHVSSILRHIELENIGNKYQNEDNGTKAWYMEVGFLWEEYLSLILGNRLGQRIGEVILDGIAGSPDGLNKDKDGAYLEEYKCTWMGTQRDPSNNWYWMAQIKAYCKMLGLTRAKLLVLHINGDYRENRGPRPRAYQLTFTVQEIEENWNSILHYKKILERGPRPKPVLKRKKGQKISARKLLGE